MGDALNALRPQRLRTKAASSLLPHWLDGYSECNSCSSRVLLAHVESANCPVAYQGLKITSPFFLIFTIIERQKGISRFSLSSVDSNSVHRSESICSIISSWYFIHIASLMTL
ncbi:hypothetical protein [Bathymodiolus japonicus methanotrophic gill symbiont]|uniref:hypothetical protein n=1 Tax=Bathymodiolus japonicus methanotrophic gill symbiont TaxID=113269 RepID=UPI001C8D43E8|nr:hypothetical protein [Bathymodiolus japonicus methanotrophic gill symbiont]